MLGLEPEVFGGGLHGLGEGDVGGSEVVVVPVYIYEAMITTSVMVIYTVHMYVYLISSNNLN